MPIKPGPNNLEVSSFTPRTAETYADRTKSVNMELGISEGPTDAGELPTIIMPEKQIFQDNLKELNNVLQIKEGINAHNKAEQTGFIEHTQSVHRIEFAIPEQNKQRIITRIEDYLFYEPSQNFGAKHTTKIGKQHEIKLPSEIRQEVTPQDIIDFVHVLLSRGVETAWPISLEPCDRLKVNILTLIPTIESLAKLFDIMQLYKLQNFKHAFSGHEYVEETGELGILNRQLGRRVNAPRGRSITSTNTTNNTNNTTNTITTSNADADNTHTKAKYHTISRAFLSIFITHLQNPTHKNSLNIIAGIANLPIESLNNLQQEGTQPQDEASYVNQTIVKPPTPSFHQTGNNNPTLLLLNALNKTICRKIRDQNQSTKVAIHPNANIITTTTNASNAPIIIEPFTTNDHSMDSPIINGIKIRLEI